MNHIFVQASSYWLPHTQVVRDKTESWSREPALPRPASFYTFYLYMYVFIYFKNLAE